jgi:transposase
MAVKVIGLDTAKHVFHLHGADASGVAVLRKRLRRSQVTDFFSSISTRVVGIEATQGAHCWARVIGSFVSVRPTQVSFEKRPSGPG